MKTIEYAAKNYKTQCLDGRDFVRLAKFIPYDLAIEMDIVKDGCLKAEWDKSLIPYTEAAVIEQLKSDIEFGFEKALGERGISSALMYEVVKMWMWVLEDDDYAFWDEYGMYGLPLFESVANKYDFPDPS